MTLVLDASVLVELLLLSAKGRSAVPRVRAAEGDIHLPHLADIEAASVLRGLVLGGQLGADRAAAALADVQDFPATRWPADVLFERVWELRSNLTAYDANYVALAETLDAELLTADARLLRGAEGMARCPVVLVS